MVSLVPGRTLSMARSCCSRQQDPAEELHLLPTSMTSSYGLRAQGARQVVSRGHSRLAASKQTAVRLDAQAVAGQTRHTQHTQGQSWAAGSLSQRHQEHGCAGALPARRTCGRLCCPAGGVRPRPRRAPDTRQPSKDMRSVLHGASCPLANCVRATSKTAALAAKSLLQSLRDSP